METALYPKSVLRTGSYTPDNSALLQEVSSRQCLRVGVAGWALHGCRSHVAPNSKTTSDRKTLGKTAVKPLLKVYLKINKNLKVLPCLWSLDGDRV